MTSQAPFTLAGRARSLPLEIIGDPDGAGSHAAGIASNSLVTPEGLAERVVLA